MKFQFVQNNPYMESTVYTVLADNAPEVVWGEAGGEGVVTMATHASWSHVRLVGILGI